MVPTKPVMGDFVSTSGKHWRVNIMKGDTGFAQDQSSDTKIALTFRPGLYNDVSGVPYRFSRIIHDADYAGVSLPDILQ